MLHKGFLLLAILLLAGCGGPPGPTAPPTQLVETPRAATGTALTMATAPRSLPTAVPTPTLSPSPTATLVPPTRLAIKPDPFQEARQALAAYLPETDAQPVVSALLPGIESWLAAGGELSNLETLLNATPSQAQEGPARVSQLDLTGDGRQDVIVYIPVQGLPLLVFVSEDGRPTSFAGYALPPELKAIRDDWTLETYSGGKPPVRLEDLTGDGVPEVVFTTQFVGASFFCLRPRAFQWHEGGFRLIFYADVVDWAGTSDFDLEPDPTGKDRRQFVLTGPYLYNHGFDEKFAPHPAGEQIWRWSEEAGRFVLAEAKVDLEHNDGHLGSPAEIGDQLRWLTNQGEEAFRAGLYEEAVRSYEQVLSEADAHNWQRPEWDADWRAYAAFRRAETLLLQANPAGLPAMEAVASSLKGDILGELAGAFLQGYGDGSKPDAAARGVVAMQAVDLYGYFYNRSEGTLVMMDADGILYPAAGLAAYVNAHLDLIDDLPALEAGLREIGLPAEVSVPGEGTLRFTLLVSDAPNAYGELEPWLLTDQEGIWRVSLAAGDYEWPTIGAFTR